MGEAPQRDGELKTLVNLSEMHHYALQLGLFRKHAWCNCAEIDLVICQRCGASRAFLTRRPEGQMLS